MLHLSQNSNNFSAQARQQKSPRRSLLYVPGDSHRKIEKATGLQVDTLILDLEDGVAASQKLIACQTIVESLGNFNFGKIERLIRLNSLESGLAEDDLTATVAAQPDGYVVSKVESPEDLVDITYWLDEAEQLQKWPQNRIRLFAMIETALGIMNLREICIATPRLDGLIFGAEDYAASVGAMRTRTGFEVLYARSAIVAAAGAYGLQAIDHVCVDLDDLSTLEEQCSNGSQLGFRGKTAIHPKQIEIINRCFSPSAAEVERAQRLIAAYEAFQQSGQGAFVFEGKMVDLPVVRSARATVDRFTLSRA